MPDLRPVFFVVGLMIAALGVSMFAPMGIDLIYEGRSWRAFGISGILTTLLGAAVAMATYTPKPKLRARGAFLLTVLSWIALSGFAAIPFMLDPMNLSLTDALFEATSVSYTHLTLPTNREV